MKRFYLTLIALFAITSLFSQKLSENFEKHKGCSHSKSGEHIHKTQNVLVNNYDVNFYKIDLSVTNTSTYIEGVVTINSKVVNETLNQFVVELINPLTVDQITVNGVTKTFTHSNDEIIIDLAQDFAVDSELSVEIEYYGNPSFNGFFSGISSETDDIWNKQVMWTLSEPLNAKQWWPCKQTLDDKADSCHVFITVPNNLMAGSNGLLTAIVDLPGDKKRFEWKSNYPISYYLISMAVAEYQEYNNYAHPEGITDSILIQNFIYDAPGYLTQNQDDIDATADLVEMFSGLYTMYPFKDEKYGNCLAPLGGGMEHQTMSTVDNFGFGLNAHELAHQWFGDNVTCSSWQDIWVNEGFASYSEYIALQNLKSQQQADNWISTAHDYALDAQNGSVYVPFEDAENDGRIFSYSLTYKKGGSIIHNLRFEIDNDDNFFQSLQDIQTTYNNDFASGEDVKEIFEDNSGMDFTDFFDQWYYGEGYPTYNIEWYQEADTLIFTSTQTTSAPSVTPLFKMLMEYKVETSEGDQFIKVYQTENIQEFRVPITGNVNGIVVDPNDWVIDGEASVVTGINIVSDLKANVYPNPVNDVVYITDNYKGTNKTIQIVDISGKIIMENTSNTSITEINLSEIGQGVYFVHIKTDTGTYTEKIMKLE